jgi:ComF family protein
MQTKVLRRTLNVPACTAGQKEALSPVYVYSALRYTEALKQIIRRWKYDGVIEFTEWLAMWTCAAFSAGRFGVAAGSNSSTEDASELHTAYDWIVPVPTTDDRYRKRGYHHVLLLAEEVSRCTHVPVISGLHRNAGRDFTGSQTTKTAAERRKSLESAFYVVQPERLKGKRIALVDDIVTTGATLLSCAVEVLQAGAAEVTCFVIADVQ